LILTIASMLFLTIAAIAAILTIAL